MRRKMIFTLLAMALLLACDSDFRQGNCDEGFFEQSDGQGGSFCVPITEEDGTIDDTTPESGNLKHSD